MDADSRATLLTNDLIAAEDSPEGHYARPPKRQVSEKESRGEREFNISLIVSLVSNLAATAT